MCFGAVRREFVQQHLEGQSPFDPKQFASIVRDAVMQLVQHEVDESILVNGVRVFDPHR